MSSDYVIPIFSDYVMPIFRRQEVTYLQTRYIYAVISNYAVINAQLLSRSYHCAVIFNINALERYFYILYFSFLFFFSFFILHLLFSVFYFYYT